MTKFSIITPVHEKSSSYLEEAYRSLLGQSVCDWEWVIVTNGGGKVPERISSDARVKIFPIEDDDPQHNKIGRLKGYACSVSTGEILIELDADDMLVKGALEELSRAFDDASVMMAYSNAAEFVDETWEPHVYSEWYGWKTRPFDHEGHLLQETVAWPPSAQMMRYIYWAPDHVRAWRASAYQEIGGHDQSLKTGDDHDLCCRFYIAYGERGIKHIDKCLYLYRRHESNSSVTNNAGVQEQTNANYIRYSRAMATRWAKDKGLRLLDLGGRINAWEGYETVDLFDAEIVADLNQPWPFEDNSVGVIRASHIFEHLRDPIHTMNEAFRVLAPGGWLLIEVPSTDGRGAFQDPTHVSFWNQNSIWYYTNKDFAKFIPSFKGRFQNSRTITYFPSEFELAHDIPIVQADLIAIKGDYASRPVGEILI